MFPKNLQEHTIKETLKRAVDSNPKFSSMIKHDLKLIIDASKSEADLVRNVMAYLFGSQL